VFAGSSSVYGDTPTLPKREDMPPNPLSPYALQNWSASSTVRCSPVSMVSKRSPSATSTSLVRGRIPVLPIRV
jgi:hypothetical protein